MDKVTRIQVFGNPDEGPTYGALRGASVPPKMGANLLMEDGIGGKFLRNSTDGRCLMYVTN